MGSLLMDLKLDRAFGHLDVNRNGYVEFDDVIALSSRLADSFQEPPAGEKRQQLDARFADWWHSLVAAIDADDDQRITPVEWNEGMVKAFVDSETGFDEHFRPLAEAAFELADIDGDGAVEQAEFLTWQKAFRTPVKAAKEAFAHLDADRDAKLSLDELVAAARQYYTGKGNPAGDWLYGRIGS